MLKDFRNLILVARFRILDAGCSIFKFFLSSIQHRVSSIFFYFLLSTFIAAQTPVGMISGKIVQQETAVPVADCNIIALPSGKGSVSDSLGLFVLQLPYGDYELEFTHLGFKTVKKTVSLSTESPKIRLVIEMKTQAIAGKTITVLDKRGDVAPGVQELDQQEIRRMPAIYSDVLRTIKILPGVSSNNELSSAYNVRGGNFDENLIYLNGYEIYRPFLIRQGVEENQSLINPDLIDDLQFYSGAFPANLGDKMSSALTVNYRRTEDEAFSGSARADLFNYAVAARGSSGKLRWSGGVRYVNPDLFVSKLQTTGSYRPFFADVQALLNYDLTATSSLELFVLNARNRFDLTPANWAGNFKFNLFDVRAIDIEYQGERSYTFQTGLLGLRFDKRLDPETSFRISLAGYNTTENETAGLTGDIFYDSNPIDNRNIRQFLKSRFESADNDLVMRTYEIQSSFQKIAAKHFIDAGINVRYTNLENNLDESLVEEGEDSIQETPFIEKANQKLNLAYFSGYIQDIFTINKHWQATFGMRVLHFNYNSETDISPRGSLQFFPGNRNSLNFKWGVYHQPPFFYELRNKNLETQQPLKSQRAIHYILGWKHHFEEERSFQAEVFYKQLDNLVPYYLDQLKIIYADENSLRGFAYGLDILFKGEIVNTLNSWISYSYLKTREKTITGSEDYNRRLLDQTHTLRIFLQDKIPQHPNIQAHLRMLFGSGYLFHPRTVVADDVTGNPVLAVDFDRRNKFQAYSRFDLGMSARLKLGKGREAVLTAEVLNVFNHINVAGYSWFQALPGQPVRVPHIFTRRFFNAGIEVGF